MGVTCRLSNHPTVISLLERRKATQVWRDSFICDYIVVATAAVHIYPYAFIALPDYLVLFDIRGKLAPYHSCLCGTLEVV